MWIRSENGEVLVNTAQVTAVSLAPLESGLATNGEKVVELAAWSPGMKSLLATGPLTEMLRLLEEIQHQIEVDQDVIEIEDALKKLREAPNPRGRVNVQKPGS